MQTRCLGGFSVIWVTKLLISQVKKGFFAQKRPNLAQNWHFWSIWARSCRLIQCPVGGSVGGCGARAVSRKTPIYFIFLSGHCIFGAQYKLNITWLICSANFQYLLYNIFTVNWRLISLYCCYFVANNLRLRNARILWAILASKPRNIFPKSKH